MNTYFFTYQVKLPNGSFRELSYKCEARRLSFALKLFNREAESFSFPVYFLNPRYSVMNSVGIVSYRLLPAKYLLFRGGKDA